MKSFPVAKSADESGKEKLLRAVLNSTQLICVQVNQSILYTGYKYADCTVETIDLNFLHECFHLLFQLQASFHVSMSE